MASKNLNELLGALSSEYRRQLLFELLEHDPHNLPLNAFDDVSEDIDRDSHLIELVHKDLPKLDNLNYIEWDRNTHEINKGDNWEDIEPFLAHIISNHEELPHNWF